LEVRYSVFGIPHHRPTPRFAELTVKEIREQSGGALDLNPANTRVLCSTPSQIEQYAALGFPILPAEAVRKDDRWVVEQTPPIDLVRPIGAQGMAALEEEWVRWKLHPASLSVLKDFPEVVRTLQDLYGEPLLGDEGSITESRDYDSYVRSMAGVIDL